MTSPIYYLGSRRNKGFMKTKLGVLRTAVFFVVLSFSCKRKNEQPGFVRSEEAKEFICATDFHILNKNSPSTSVAVGAEKYFWPNNPGGPIVIHVKFLQGGNDYIFQKVEHYAKEWEKYANVRFDFVDRAEPAEIRISFDVTDETFVKAIGIYLLDFAEDDQYNMHFEGLSNNSQESEISESVLHQFGHVLGLMHEQYHPRARWNKPYIYAYYSREKGWSKKEVDKFFFKGFQMFDPKYSKYDSKSIMHYWYPEKFALNHVGEFGSSELSDGDKKFIQKIYPFPPAILKRSN